MLKNKKNLRAYLSLAIVLLVTFGMFLAFAFTGSANDETAPAEKPEINVWLIGGQSNAVGYANDVSEYQAQDNRYFEGFDNVLYYGYSETFVPGIEEVQFGQGQKLNKAGAELGIANALADSGTMNIVIKYAQGATYLYPNTTADVSKNYGTWTSPTYIKNHNVDTAGTKTGLLYTKFIETVTSTCAQLEEMGYTPVVRGMWWMQGEAECSNATAASAYAELLETLINDVRQDVGKITGQDLSNMPFAFGKIYRNPNPEYSKPQYLSVVTDCQAQVAAKEGFNAILVDPTKCEGLGQHDGWHFNAATQSYFGEMLVLETLKHLGLSMVDVEGTNVTLSGGGFHKAGDSVTVKLTAPEGYTITGVTMTVDGVATPITLDNGTYTFTSEGKNVVFKATTEGSDEATPYGNIPAEFDADNYPVALFNNGFVGAYTYYGAALDAAKGILYGNDNADKSATIYFRRDYASSKKDASSEIVTHLGGVLNIDLGGNSFTRTNKGYFLDAVAKATDGTLFTSTVNTKNGELIYTGSPFVGVNHNTESLLNGTVKNMAINFENVIFSVAEGAATNSGIVTACWENGTNGATFDMSFVNCTFDMTNAPAGISALNFSGSGKTLTVVNSEIKGGSIILGANSVKFITSDALDSNVYTADANGNYVTLKVPAGASISGYEDYYSNGVDGKLVKFDLSKTEGGFDFYVMNVYEDTVSEVTDYGTIPAEYISKADYPFVLFKADNKQFVGGYADLGAALNGMKKTSKTDAFVILMRRDAEMNTKTSGDGNLWSYRGEVKIDLGGFNLSLTDAGNYLFDLSVQDNSAATLTEGIDVRASYTVVDGSITKNGGHALICMNYGASIKHTATFSFYFEGVTFASTTNAKIPGVITNTWENEDKGITTTDTDPMVVTDMVFDNCVFDYVNSVDGVVMLPMKALKYTGDRVVYNIEVKGGKLVSDKPVGVGNIFTANDNENGRADSFTFVADANGEYTTLELSEGVSAPIATFNDGTLMFKEDSSANGTVTYKLGTVDVVLEPEFTIYGDIPVDYLDKNAYPIVMFNPEGDFIGGYADFGNATADMISKGVNKDYIVYFRANATRNVKTSNHYKLTGNILIDLNGFTLTNTTNGYMLDIFVGGNGTDGVDKRATYTFKNGTINTAKVLFCINYGNLQRDVEIYFNFDNVTFIATHSGNVLFQTWENGYVDANGAIKTLDVDVSETTYATFNGCTFDYASSNSGALFFDASYTKNGKTGDISVVKVTINGGKIIAKTASSINSFIKFDDDTHGRADTLVFGTYDGEYTKLVLPAGENAPTTAIKNLLGGAMYDLVSADGRELAFVNVSTSETADEYVLVINCKDDNGDHKCDSCDYVLSECDDKDNNHYCDVCGEKASDCIDADNDHACDVCKNVLTDCADENKDHKCDVCGTALSECADENGNHKCDVCDKTLTECIDENKDHKCEICGATSECNDGNTDHKCDVCEKTLTECNDGNKDHKCDVCDKTLSECTDADDHKCDVCKKVISECADNNNDHKCDVCDKLISNCVDKDKNHNCDICDKTLTQCSDKNNDHKCDLCEAVLTECADEDGNHACDLCGAVLSECADENSDHKCDLCEATVSTCNDADSDHKCDICDKVLTTCRDTNNDHSCDTCDDVLTKCDDANKDHKCDLCDKVTSECTDADANHTCDLCGKTVSECKDENGDDKCDVCEKVLKVATPEEPEAEKTVVEKVKTWFEDLIAKISEFFSSIMGKIKGENS